MPVDRPPAPLIDPRALVRILDRQAKADGPPWLHQEVARRMAERLPVIRRPPANWLDWWAFTGAGAAPVQGVWPKAVRQAVEPTTALLARSVSASALPWWSIGRHLRPGSAPALLSEAVPDGQADMVWANLVLHAQADPPRLLSQWHRALAVDGFVMFSCFGPDTLRELRELYAEAGWPAPHPPYADMHDVGDALLQAGFADPVMDQERLQLTWSSPTALLAELRSLGGHLGQHRFAGLRTPRWRQQLMAALQRRADPQGRIMLGFELVYGHAYKVMPRAGKAESSTVSLDQLRATLPKRNT